MTMTMCMIITVMLQMLLNMMALTKTMAMAITVSHIEVLRIPQVHALGESDPHHGPKAPVTILKSYWPERSNQQAIKAHAL